jgi:hypothetical protein
LLKQRNQGSIKAFGILGNDLYDKLLVIQALKERFPSHLYFTTDLDAGYLDAKVSGETRNLIVAAPFDLSLDHALDRRDHERSQGRAMPFRYSYQTSVNLTVLRALEGRESELAPSLGGFGSDRQPAVLFEVGYGRFFRLKSPGEDPAERSGSATTRMAGNAAHLPPPWRAGIREFMLNHGLSAAVVAFLAVALVILVWRLKPLEPAPGAATRDAHRARLALTAYLAVTLFYGLVAIFWLGWAVHLNIEPFAWISGVSIWPSEMVRLGAGWGPPCA